MGTIVRRTIVTEPFRPETLALKDELCAACMALTHACRDTAPLITVRLPSRRPMHGRQLNLSQVELQSIQSLDKCLFTPLLVDSLGCEHAHCERRRIPMSCSCPELCFDICCQRADIFFLRFPHECSVAIPCVLPPTNATLSSLSARANEITLTYRTVHRTCVWIESSHSTP